MGAIINMGKLKFTKNGQNYYNWCTIIVKFAEKDVFLADIAFKM